MNDLFEAQTDGRGEKHTSGREREGITEDVNNDNDGVEAIEREWKLGYCCHLCRLKAEFTLYHWCHVIPAR